jgi:hypothetical protein
VLEASLAFSGGMTIPLMSEFLSYTQGDTDTKKQDSEQKAFKRLAKRLKEKFGHLSIHGAFGRAVSQWANHGAVS